MNGFLSLQLSDGFGREVEFAVPDFWLATQERPWRASLGQLAYTFDLPVPSLSEVTAAVLAASNELSTSTACWMLAGAHLWTASCVLSLRWLMLEDLCASDRERCTDSLTGLWAAIDAMHDLSYAWMFQKVNEQGAREVWQELREEIATFRDGHKWLWDLEVPA